LLTYDRHKAIIAYLSSSNLPSSAAALREEIKIGDTFDEATSKKYEGLLEKKWTSVVRLQKKVGSPASALLKRAPRLIPPSSP
jgi:hypothetical protein